MRDRPQLIGQSLSSIEFANGSRIVSLPGSSPASIRGYSNPRLIIVDESAWFPDDVYAALRPMMSQGNTKLALLSSAGGRSGFYYQEYSFNTQDWDVHEVDCYQCPHLSPEFLEQEKRKDSRIFQREYLCMFQEFDDQVFRLSDIEASITTDVPLLDLKVRADVEMPPVERKPALPVTDGRVNPDRFFPGPPMRWVMAIDIGKLIDPTAIVVIEKSVNTMGEVMHAVRFACRLKLGLSYPQIVAAIGEIYDQLSLLTQPPIVVVDATGGGGPVVDAMKAAGIECVGITLTAGGDWAFDGAGGVRLPKSTMVTVANLALQEERVAIGYDIPALGRLHKELGGYRVKMRNGREQFENSSAAEHDDVAVAFCLGIFAAENLGQSGTRTHCL
jgi:hypothetical protein